MGIDRVKVTKRGIDRSQAAQGSELMRRTKKEGRPTAGHSTKVKELDRLAAEVEQSRTERLNDVRQKLDSGTYRVSAKTIARKLIDSNRK
jgi:anti-sigma28 factor (negative regulator of flagellin synthesis)